MTLIDTKLWALVEELWFSSVEMKQKVFDELLESFGQRMMVDMLSVLWKDQQKHMMTLMGDGRDPQVVYTYLHEQLEDVDVEIGKSLDAFIRDYRGG